MPVTWSVNGGDVLLHLRRDGRWQVAWDPKAGAETEGELLAQGLIWLLDDEAYMRKLMTRTRERLLEELGQGRKHTEVSSSGNLG